MPIRIRPDKDQGNYTPRNSGGNTSGGGGGIGQLLPVLIGLFGRNPKMLLIIAVIGIIFYFAGGKGCGGLMTENAQPSDLVSNLFSTGANFDIKKYASTEIYEPLADNKKNPLPEKFSLEQFAPDRLNQGQQGSCVAWASAYAARSIMQTRATGTNPNSNTFSPSFLYNQIALEGCQGSYLQEAMNVMKGTGLAPYRDMPYTDQDCSKKPDGMLIRKASDYKIDGYNRLSGGRNGEDPKAVNMLAIKQNIAQGAPVVIGMMVGGSFMQDMMGKENWRATDSDLNMSGFGGHAMCVIGYDDYKYGPKMGGFQIMNSWGNEWGKNGIAWVSYEDFEIFTKEAYGIFPGDDANAPKTSVLNASLGIVMNKDGKNVSLSQTGPNTFQTTGKITINEDFKIEVINNNKCYIYLFGSETDGKIYTLFPYTAKHSPYCGITGRRLFPRDHSLYADEQGTADEFAVVVSATALDYELMRSQIDAASGVDMPSKISQVIGNAGQMNVNSGNQIQLVSDLGREPICAAVIRVMK